MSNKEERERKEMQNLFADPKFSRKAWQSVGRAILRQPARTPMLRVNKDGIETADSELERYTYDHLAEDLKKLGGEGDREPTELELILGCQIVKARTDTQAAVFIRDTVGAKPVDESKLDAQINNPYESMSDEELETLAAIREGRMTAVPTSSAVTTPVESENNND